MCGISGFNWEDERLIRRMSSVLSHRGPDQHGIYTDRHVSLGHRRLSIIDLSEAGRQPMTNKDELIWVTYNGEIYNFKDLRRSLEGKGHTFKSNTDTEVIVHAYEEYGPKCLEKFNGMFAFALWDRIRKTLFVARDRLGVKPLYYYFKNGRFIFASEIKAILQDPAVVREIDDQSLYYYLGYEFVPAPATIFKHIFKLPPGHYLLLRDGKMEIVQYWDLNFAETDYTREYYEEGLRHLLGEAVRKRLVSDVPLGVLLSGGIDSSSLVAFMSQYVNTPIKTFTLGYEQQAYTEFDYAKKVAHCFDTKHTELMIDPISPETVQKVVWHLDEPFSEFSLIPLYMVSEKARHYVTVSLSGEGGDEVFAGYDRFIASKLDRYLAKIPQVVRGKLLAALRLLPDRPPKKGLANSLNRFAEGAMLPSEGAHVRWQYFLRLEQATHLLSEAFKEKLDMNNPFIPLLRYSIPLEDTLSQELYYELKFIMPDNPLMKVDKMSMAHALEIRTPFLDYELVEFCATIPSDLKLQGFSTKAIFKSAMERLLPRESIYRKKHGYAFPIKHWLRNDLKEFMLETLNNSAIINEYFKSYYVKRMIDEHLQVRQNHSHLLWALINLAVWHRMFIQGDAVGR